MKASSPKFPLGLLVATQTALDILSPTDIQTGLSRHLQGDWGDLGEEDLAANDLALQDGSRLLSQYHSEEGIKFWIITEADRSATIVLLPYDY